MDISNPIANIIAANITASAAENSANRTALIGLAGVIVGALILPISNFLVHYYQSARTRKLERVRKALLNQMLSDPRFRWRKIETLSRVIGADEEETKLLLIAIGARGSEANDDLWGLLERHPLNQVSEE